jgi:hypothetical protein
MAFTTVSALMNSGFQVEESPADSISLANLSFWNWDKWAAEKINLVERGGKGRGEERG